MSRLLTTLGALGRRRRAGGGGVTCDKFGVTAVTPGSLVGAGASQVGWRFTVGASDITFCGWRHYRIDAGPGARDSANQTFRLWDNATSTELASLSVTDISTVNEWVEYDATSPVTLSAGASYTVTAYDTDVSRAVAYAVSGVTMASEITFGINVRQATTAYPTTTRPTEDYRSTIDLRFGT